MSDRTTGETPRISRRKALTVAAGIGVTVAASSVAGVALATDEKDNPYEGPLVVHVRDVSAGVLDVFTGSQRIEVRDKDLAGKLARAAARK